MHRPVTAIIANVLLLLPCSSLRGTECLALPPLKPIHHVCGFVVDPLGQPVSGATVTVLAGSDEIARVQTSEDGAFELDQLKAGTYKIHVWKTGFVTAYSSFTLVAPRKECKKELGVSLGVGTMCSGISQGKLKRPKMSD